MSPKSNANITGLKSGLVVFIENPKADVIPKYRLNRQSQPRRSEGPKEILIVSLLWYRLSVTSNAIRTFLEGIVPNGATPMPALYPHLPYPIIHLT
jgi:hypothetical protein